MILVDNEVLGLADAAMVDEAGKAKGRCKGQPKTYMPKTRKRQLAALVDVEVDTENAEPGLLIQKNRQCLFCF